MGTLISPILKDIPRLEECANGGRQITVKKPPEAGKPIEALQDALQTVGFADFDFPEVSSHSYGSSTADMVLKFKKKFNILRPGQLAPDNIVDQPTIKKLDELTKGSGGGAGADPNALIFNVSPGKVLKGKVFWLTSGKEGTGMMSNPIPRYQVAATRLLSQHNMRCSVIPTTPSQLVEFNTPLARFDVTTADWPLRAARKAVGNVATTNEIVIIVGKFAQPFEPQTAGTTLGYTEFNSPFFPFDTTLFINSEFTSTDGITLVHEMGHAAGSDLGGILPVEWTKDRFEKNFMSHKGQGAARDEMMRWQGEALAASSFAVNEV